MAPRPSGLSCVALRTVLCGHDVSSSLSDFSSHPIRRGVTWYFVRHMIIGTFIHLPIGGDDGFGLTHVLSNWKEIIPWLQFLFAIVPVARRGHRDLFGNQIQQQ